MTILANWNVTETWPTLFEVIRKHNFQTKLVEHCAGHCRSFLTLPYHFVPSHLTLMIGFVGCFYHTVLLREKTGLWVHNALFDPLRFRNPSADVIWQVKRWVTLIINSRADANLCNAGWWHYDKKISPMSLASRIYNDFIYYQQICAT